MLPFLSLAQFVIPWRIEHPEIVLSTVVGFVLLALLVSRVPIPHLSIPYYRKTLAERSDRIETNKQQVDTAIDEIEQLKSDSAARLTQIEDEARQRIDAAVREADAARAEIIAEAEQTAQAIRRRSEEEVSRERTRQRILFRQQLVKTALDSAEEAITESTNATVQHRLIGDFITMASTGAAAQSPPRGGA